MMWGLMSSGTQCLGGDDGVGLNVFRADVLGTQCLGKNNSVTSVAFCCRVFCCSCRCLFVSSC